MHINDDGDLPGFAAARSAASTGSPAAARRCATRSTRSAPRSPRPIAAGARFIVLSDRDSDAELAPIPSLLLTAAVHHHLIREQDPHPGRARRRGRRRPRGAPRRAAHRLRRRGGQPLPGDGVASRTWSRRGVIAGVEPEQAVRNLIKALGKGVLKVMSQDGHLDGRRPTAARRSSRRSGSARTSSSGTSPAPSSKLGGVGLDVARRGGRPPARAAPTRRAAPAAAHRRLDVGGEYQWRREGELHLFDPETVFRLQHATRARRYDVFKQYTAGGRRAVRAADDPARAVPASRTASGRRCRSTRSSRSARSSSASPPARCPTARSRRRRTRRWRSR